MSGADSNWVSLGVRDRVATVRLDPPAATALLEGVLSGVFAGLRDDSGVRAVILTGDFSPAAGQSPELSLGRLRDFHSLCSLIENLGKPVIAAIPGDASGPGLALALSCTFRFALATSRLLAGDLPSGGALARLASIAGRSRALELALTGEPIDARRALELDLVNRLAESPEALLVEAETLAARIASLAPIAVGFALETVSSGSRMNIEQGLLLESALFATCFSTEDVREGASAFLDKRPPDFKGR